MAKLVLWHLKAICDGCGNTGAYDFYGDYFCDLCSSPEVDSYGDQLDDYEIDEDDLESF